MAEKACPHGTPATSFCKACERGEPARESVKVADLHLDAAAAPAGLSETEQTRRDALEETVKVGLKTFAEVGMALLEIRDHRLYRSTHGTFAEYCKAAFGFSRQRGQQLMQAAEVATVVDIPNEAQARELVPLLDDPPALREALAEAGEDGTPTAPKVRAAVAKRKPRAEVVPVPEQLQLNFEVDDDVRRWRAVADDAGMELEEWLAALANAAVAEAIASGSR